MERILYDFLTTFEGGVNSDLAPILLPKNVAAWTTNATLRGGFIRPRPARFERALNFPTTEVETLFLSGLFQGAGYYRTDFGAQQLVVQVSGRLFKLVEASNGWDVTEITIAGDPNSATTQQVWMNQAERWLIISDGTAALPIFWDGVTARRSAGPSRVLATAAASGNFPNPRVIGEIIPIILTEDYTGPYNETVIFNGEFYQTLPGGGSPTEPGYEVILTNLLDNPGVVIPTGTPITIQPGLIGYTFDVPGAFGDSGKTTFFQWPPDPTLTRIRFFLARPSGSPIDEAYGLSVGSQVSLRGTTFTIDNIVLPLLGATMYEGFAPYPPVGGVGVFPDPEPVRVPGVNDPESIIGITIEPYSVPPQTGTVDVKIDRLYSGNPDQVVWIGNKRYLINAGDTTIPPSSSINLLNLTDTSDAGAAIPTGSPAGDILSVPELPAGRMGAYGLGHQAWCLVDGLSFIYGDTVGGPSGSQAENYRDAVLKTTENTFLETRGSFRVPTSGEIITSMTFTAILDAAYGQGPLEIGTQSFIFTCAVPTNQADWAALENPILTQALIGDGPLSQDSTKLANSDTLFRTTEGLGSLIFARRNFETWGNTPISTEMNRLFDLDDRSLLGFASAASFDNRFLHTASPATTAQGTTHAALAVLNFDPVSSLRGKAPSIWESKWHGLNILKVVRGVFNGLRRCFYFAFDATNGIQLWEQLRSDSSEYLDNGTDRITYTLETPCIFKPDERQKEIPLVRLTNGKIHVDEVRGEVQILVQFRPDFHAGWTDWITLNISDTTNPGYVSPIGLGEPSSAECNAPNNRPLRTGRFFQLKFTVTGQCRIMGQEYSAVPEPTINFPSPNCDTIES